MPSLVGAHLFNLVEFERSNGTSCHAEFYAGDMFEVPSDVVVISSFAGEYSPVPGTLLGALAERFGVRFDRGLPPNTTTHSSRLHRVPVTPTESFKALWILDFRDLFDPKPPTVGELREILETLVRHSREIVPGEGTSVSLPLLGTGDQGLPIREVAEETLRLIRRWSKREPRLKVVRVFAHDLEKVAILNRTIDSVLKYPDGDLAPTSSVKAASEELETVLKGTEDRAIRNALDELKQLASVAAVSPKSVAIQGRVVAEICCDQLFKKSFPDKPLPYTLKDRIAVLQSRISGELPWMFSYLKLLQTCGNHFAHPSAYRLEAGDVAAVLLAAARFASFVDERVADQSA
jgi:hypothetical protein